MVRRNISTSDASSYAASELEYVIKKRRESEQAPVPAVPTSTPQEAMRGDRVYAATSQRDVTRVLFISQNTELLNPTKQTLDGYINIADLFDEVHILILRTGIAPRQPVLRVDTNVWIYTASGTSWWSMVYNGLQLTVEQLVFADGFRPDLIVARDEYESAVVAQRLARKYNVPTQLHILEREAKPNLSHSLMSRWLIPRFLSVRTATEGLERQINKQYAIADLATLPRFHNYELLIDVPAHFQLKDKYKPLVFFILYIGKLGHDSNLHHVMDATRFVLNNQRVGLLVVGDGPARAEFQKKAKTLGIEQQVIFEKDVADIVSYIKSANVLVVTDTDEDSEETVLLGAAAGAPLVITETPQREDIFEHGESAFLCRSGDVQMLSTRVNELMNNVNLRQHFIEQSQAMIRAKFHQDPDQYRAAYRASIEQALLGGANEAAAAE
ncbi:glycosyltransferase [Candidatus Kaiserbacteria bacterium]|nr:glycosyltransferase [Candidatus Kaiserbacteria bacterium]